MTTPTPSWTQTLSINIQKHTAPHFNPKLWQERRNDYLHNWTIMNAFHFPLLSTCKCKIQKEFHNHMQETIFPQLFSWKNSSPAPSAFLLSASTLQNLCLGQFLPVLPHIPKQYAGGPCSHRPGGTCVLFLELTPSAHASKAKKEKSPIRL